MHSLLPATLTSGLGPTPDLTSDLTPDLTPGLTPDQCPRPRLAPDQFSQTTRARLTRRLTRTRTRTRTRTQVNFFSHVTVLVGPKHAEFLEARQGELAWKGKDEHASSDSFAAV